MRAQLAQRLTELRDKGVVVHLQHPPVGKDAHRVDGRYTELQKRLARERTLRGTRARARAILSDHEVVVGSHHPLGSRTVNPARGPAPGQVGLHIIGTRSPPSSPEKWASPTGTATMSRSCRATCRRCRRWAPHPWPTTRGPCLPTGAPGTSPRTSCVASPPRCCWAAVRTAARERQAWASWLLHDAWARGAFMEAYLLAPLLGGPGGMSVDLAAVAVPVEHGPLGYQLYASTVELDAAPAEHRTVALVGAIAEMLLQGGAIGADVCEVLLDSDGPGHGLPPAWTRLGAAARDCFREEPVPPAAERCQGMGGTPGEADRDPRPVGSTGCRTGQLHADHAPLHFPGR